jgi:glycosyltransferase involved in cell wall biosynthesis
VIPVLLAFIERLAAKHEVIVVTLYQEDDPSKYSLCGAEVINLGLVDGSGARRWGVQLKRLIAALRQFGRINVLHGLWLHAPGTLAVAAGHLLGIPVVLSLGGGELVWLPEVPYGNEPSFLRQAFIGGALQMAAAVTAGSAYALKPLAKLRKDARWLPLGVDSALMTSGHKRGHGPPWRLLQVADLNAVKDQVTLLRAARLLCESGLPFQLDCLGIDTLSGKLQAMARDLGLEQTVRFHGRLPLDEVIPFYRDAHLHIQTSRFESMGAAVLEAAAAGVPLVGTNVGILAEMAPHAARTVPAGDPTGLANAILETLRHPAERESRSLAARDFAHRYNSDWTCMEFESIYQRVAA